MTALEKIKDEYYDEPEVAAALGLKIKGLRDRRLEGKNHPPFIKIGRQILYPKRDFDLWMKKLQVIREIA